MYSLCSTILVVFLVSAANTQVLSRGDGHKCQRLSMATMCEGFGYGKTEVTVAPNIGWYIEKVARSLGEAGRSADPAILPFICYSLVPKCRSGNATRSNLRPCKEACTQLEALIDPAMSEASAGRVNKGGVCKDLDLVAKGEASCVRYRKLRELGEANPVWVRLNLTSSQENYVD